MIKLAQSERGIAVDVNDLDADPWLLNVRNGTIILRTGQLRSHSHEDRITKCAPVVYEPQAKAPRWAAFLERVFAGNTELIQYVQQAVGYSLTGSTSEQCWFPTYGTGANGKSVFLSVMRALLGNREYARHTPSETLLITRGSEQRPRNDLARLQGARLVTAAETEAGQRLAESLVKQLTGEDPITARFLYQEHFEFQPTFKLWLAANFKPKVRCTDPASWRRIHLIPFNVTIPKEQRDKWLLEKLLAELPGILNWAMEGCLAWQRSTGGLQPPAVVAAAIEQYRSEMDSIGRFIQDECVSGPLCEVTSKELYHEYQEWCVHNGEVPEPQERLGAELKQRGFKPYHSRTNRGWRGLGLRGPDLDHGKAA